MAVTWFLAFYGRPRSVPEPRDPTTRDPTTRDPTTCVPEEAGGREAGGREAGGREAGGRATRDLIASRGHGSDCDPTVAPQGLDSVASTLHPVPSAPC